MLATLALARPRRAGSAAQAPAAAPAKVVPMTVRGPDGRRRPTPRVQAWAKELRAALEARKDEFRLAKPGETAELVVRIDSVGEGPGRHAGHERHAR